MLINKQELADILNLSVSMINKLMKKGLPYIKIGKSVRFDEKSVLNWIKERGK
jgi:excisionase family DNA binding protein